MSIQPDWLMWARKLQALAQTVTYAENPYDRERYRQLQNVAAEIFAAHTGQTLTTVEEWFGTEARRS
jgi:Hydrolase of X-linked nucleoside diphosphate N terminal